MQYSYITVIVRPLQRWYNYISNNCNAVL